MAQTNERLDRLSLRHDLALRKWYRLEHGA